jgi:hypothetical protein
MELKMKKVLAICLALVMVVGVSASALAAGGFVKSPSLNPAPELMDFDSLNNDCEVGLVVTPYDDKDSLSDEDEEWLKNAYDSIKGCDDLTKLNNGLSSLIQGLDIKGTSLSVSDLFFSGLTDCDLHDGHADCEVLLKAETLDRFVGLLVMDENGNWHLIDGAKVVDGNKLKFTTDQFGPFAIVVNTAADGSADDEGSEIPKAGDNSMIYLYAAMMAVSAAGMFVLVVSKSKKESN